MIAVLTQDVPRVGEPAIPAGTRLESATMFGYASVRGWYMAERRPVLVPRDAIRWEPDATEETP